MSSRAIWLKAFVAALLLSPAVSVAEVIKCKDSAGQVTYTQGSCPPGSRPLEASGDKASGAAAVSGQPGKLSPRADALRKKHESCSKGNTPECQEYRALFESCRGEASVTRVDCVAMREYEAAQVRELDRNAAGYASSDAGRCDAGDQQACDRLKCLEPLALSIVENDAVIRDCSRELSLPSTSSWAQVKQNITVHNANSRQWSGDYICLFFVQPAGAAGGDARVRPYIKVKQPVRDGAILPGFEASGLDTIFPTKVAAVEAACAAAKAGPARAR